MKAIFDNISSFITLLGDFTAPEGEVTPSENGFEYTDDNFKITSKTVRHSTGVEVRRDRITNISDKSLTISTALSKFVYSGGEYEVLSQYSEWCGESDGKWTDLVCEVSASVDETRLNVSSAPFVALRSKQSGRGNVFHILANSCYQYRVRRNFALYGTQKTVFVEIGINSRNFSYTLCPGESLDLPEILYYEFKNKLDLDAWRLHRYWNDTYPAKKLPVVYNTWMANFDGITFDYLSKQLDVAAELGVEYFVVDAGWFGPVKEWSVSVGDWQEHPESELRGRMKEFSDRVRGKGLKFGLWFEFERAALNSKTYAECPEYYFEDHGMAFVDFANPEAVDYLFSKISPVIEKYGIEFIKSDYNVAPHFDTARHSFIEYFRGYSAFLKKLRESYPKLYLECCAGGGCRLGLYTLREFDSYWTSDNHSLYAQLEIVKNTLKRMPSRALEKWVTIANTKGFREGLPDIYGKGEKTLVSGDATWNHVEAVNHSFLKEVVKGAPFGISCDLTEINRETIAVLQRSIEEFKADRDFWMNSEAHILTDTESVLVIQYNDREFKTVKISVFTKVPHQSEITLYPILADGKYSCDGKILTSTEIDTDGITVPVGTRYTASSVELKRI